MNYTLKMYVLSPHDTSFKKSKLGKSYKHTQIEAQKRTELRSFLMEYPC